MKLVTSLLILACSVNVQANPVTKVFKNIDCVKTDSCDLKSMQITITRDTDSADSPYGGKRITSRTNMEGYYETTSIEVVEKYAIVQFIRGGLFTLSAYDNAPQEVSRRTARDFFGEEGFAFVHPQWVVDSFDDDPIYASYSDQNDRHGLYKIKKDENLSVLYDDSSNYEYYFYRPELKLPRMHFSDMPTGGSYNSVNISAGVQAGKTLHSSTNASMDFRTCIYKTSEVSRNAGPKDININKAIGCLSWNNHHILNKDRSGFTNLSDIHPNALK